MNHIVSAFNGVCVCVCVHLQVNLCMLQASVEERDNKSMTHVSLVALCFDRIATQLRMNR